MVEFLVDKVWRWLHRLRWKRVPNAKPYHHEILLNSSAQRNDTHPDTGCDESVREASRGRAQKFIVSDAFMEGKGLQALVQIL